MAKTKAEESESGCWAKAADDEPVFVLRATDRAAPLAVRAWIEHARRVGCTNQEKLKAAAEVADAMETWQRERGSKAPD